MNFCEKNPDTCKNGSKCISLIKDEGSYRCLCREGTRGRNCEHSEISTTVKPAIITTEKTNVTEGSGLNTTEKIEPVKNDN